MGITTAASKLPPLKPGEFRFVTNGLQIEMEPGGEDAKGRRRFKAIASSTAKDLRGDEMQMSAMQDMVASFRGGLNVFMDHNHTAENVFGRTDSAEIRDSGQRDPRNGATIWDLHVGGTVNEPNKKAMELADSIDGGYVSFGTSIGAFVTKADKKKDGGRDIQHVDCKELSIVGIPMQQRAWTYKSADANWTKKAADAAETMLEQNALFDGEAAGGIETFSMDSESTTEAHEASEAVLGAQEVVVGDDGAETVAVAKAMDPSDRQSVLAALHRVSTGEHADRAEVIAAARALNVADVAEKGLADDELLVWASVAPETRKAAGLCPSCGHGTACDCTSCDCAGHNHDTDHDGDSAADTDMDGKAADLDALDTKSDTTTGGQEAPEATPETAPAAEAETDPAPEQKALAFEAADVVELVGHVRTLTGLLDTKSAEIALLTSALDEKSAEVDRLTKENEEAARLIEKVMALPLRRKAVHEVQTFSAQLPDFLAPEVKRLLSDNR